MDEQQFGLIMDVSKEIAKEAYNDGGKPFVKSTGELIALIPRSIHAALSPLEKWVLKKKYNITETKKLLEEKLKNVPPENIESPEPYIAVPALQYISYCMDNEELRNMYANLLANSMNKVIKNGVHPGFVEIIKQLSPDEAKILHGFKKHKLVSTIDLRYVKQDGGGIDIVKYFSTIGEETNCEDKYETEKYFNNLDRLGLISTEFGTSFVNKELYIPLKEHPYIKENEAIPDLYKDAGYIKTGKVEGFFSLTAYGKAFCAVCFD